MWLWSAGIDSREPRLDWPPQPDTVGIALGGCSVGDSGGWRSPSEQPATPPHPRLLSHRAEGAVCTGRSVTVMTASYALAFAPERQSDHSLGADTGSGSDGGVSPTTRWAQQPPSGRAPGFLDQPVRSPPDAAARFPSLVEAHLHGCKPSICLRKYKPHLGTSDTKCPCNRCLPVRWGGNGSCHHLL